MALDGVLARIPGLGGYLAQEQFDQRRALGDLSGVVTLAQAAEQARMAPLKQQMLQAQMAEMQRKAAEEQRAQTMLGDIVKRYGPRTETVRDADDEMTGTPGAVTQVQRPADLLGMGTAMLNVPGREGMGANLIATAEAAQGRRDAQVQAAQARMAELQMKIQDAQLSREQRAQAAAEQAQLRRDLVQMQIDARREMAGVAASLRQPPAPSLTTIMRDGKPVVVDARTGAVIGEAPPSASASAQNRPPAGYRFKPDGSLEAIPGGPADVRIQGQFNADTAALQSSDSAFTRLEQAANEVYSHPGLVRTVGAIGRIPNVPGSAASDAEAKLENLKSQAAFAVLQAMRDASKTGGALGNVSNFEVQQLQNNLASLQKAQSYDQIRSELQKIMTYSQEARQRLRNAFNVKHGGRSQQGGGASDGWSIERVGN